MRVTRARVRNFRCIVDSGDLALDDHLTILVGRNESGKSAFLNALVCFNRDARFHPIDICTMSGVRQRIDRGHQAESSVDMVTVTFALSDKDRQNMALSRPYDSIQAVSVTKRLDGSYVVTREDGAPLHLLSLNEQRTELLDHLRRLKTAVSSVYCGTVKDKQPQHEFVFLRREDGEKDKDNLILFQQNAVDIWPAIRTGSRVQVTNIAEAPWDRNRRALTAGIEFPLVDAIAEFERGVSGADGSLQEAYEAFAEQLSTMPRNHPLREFVPEALMMELRETALSSEGQNQADLFADRVLERMPTFAYEGSLQRVADHVAVEPRTGAGEARGEDLLRKLFDQAGVRPERILTVPETAERIQTLRTRGDDLARQMRTFWFDGDLRLDFAFFDKDQRMGLAVESLGSFDQPSRRSDGFNAFLALFAELCDLASREPTVLLLDDPTVHLHPVAQKKIIPLLETQAYQVVVATHLPFLIDPERLDRVRVFHRSPQVGSQVEADWAKAGDALAPVWGAMLTLSGGEYWVLVEGKDDRTYFELVSKHCEGAGRDCLSKGAIVFPAGGSNMPFVAQVLRTRGIRFVSVLDGDRAGVEMAKRIRKENPQAECVVTLGDLELGKKEPAIEDLFSAAFRTAAGLKKGQSERIAAIVKEGIVQLDDETLDNFARVFGRIEGLRKAAL